MTNNQKLWYLNLIILIKFSPKIPVVVNLKKPWDVKKVTSAYRKGDKRLYATSM